MNFRKPQRDTVSLDITPLIDVVFLLLIFFMLTTTFNKATQLSVDLPQANGKPDLAPELTEIEVSVDKDGQFFVNAKPLINTQRESLLRSIRPLLPQGDGTDVSFRITGDANAPHQSVITVMDVAGELGIERVQMSTVSVQAPA